LKKDTSQVEISKSFSPEGKYFLASEEPEECGYDKWEDEMTHSIWKPSNDVEYGVREPC